MKIYDNLEVVGSIVLGDNLADFPDNASLGTLVIKNECLYAYLNIGNLKTWYPLGVKTQSHVHMQAIPSLKWTVFHELKTRDVWYQVKNSEGNIVHPASTNIIDENTLEINFSYAISGTAVIVGSSMLDVPTIKTTGIKVGEGVDIGSDFIRIEGKTVLTQASIKMKTPDTNKEFLMNNANEIIMKGDSDLIQVDCEQGAFVIKPTDKLKNFVNNLDQKVLNSLQSLNITDGGSF